MNGREVECFILFYEWKWSNIPVVLAKWPELGILPIFGFMTGYSMSYVDSYFNMWLYYAELVKFRIKKGHLVDVLERSGIRVNRLN